MNERKMRIIILILLVCLNLLLVGYYGYQRLSVNRVPAERIEQVVQLYSEAGIDFAVLPERNNFPKANLELGEADLDALAENYLGSGFDKSYIYGSKVQYTSGSVLVITDREQHRISYQDEAIATGGANGRANGRAGAEMAEGQVLPGWSEKNRPLGEEEEKEMLLPSARNFAKQWLGKNVYLYECRAEAEGFYFLFYQMKKEEILFFNQIEIWIAPGGIQRAEIQYWDVAGEVEYSYELLPTDEVLYAMLSMMQEDITEPSAAEPGVGGNREEVTAILDGYELKEAEEQTVAVPCTMAVLQSGRKYRMNRGG